MSLFQDKKHKTIMVELGERRAKKIPLPVCAPHMQLVFVFRLKCILFVFVYFCLFLYTGEQEQTPACALRKTSGMARFLCCCSENGVRRFQTFILFFKLSPPSPLVWWAELHGAPPPLCLSYFIFPSAEQKVLFVTTEKYLLCAIIYE